MITDQKRPRRWRHRQTASFALLVCKDQLHHKLSRQRQTDRQTRLTDRQKQKQKHRQTDRQTDRQTETERQRQRKEAGERQFVIHRIR